jgi:hypothetical protein
MTPSQPTRQRLAQLVAAIPAGTRVQHLDDAQGNWTGAIAPDYSGDPPGHTIGTSPAHAVAGTADLVHVQPDAGTGLPPMWMNITWLQVIAPDAPYSTARPDRSKTERATSPLHPTMRPARQRRRVR